MKLRHLTICLIILLLADCTASGPTYSSLPETALQPKEGMARFVIYRPESFKYFLRPLSVRVNGTQVCDLKNGSFFIRDMAPWRLTLSAHLSHMPGTSWIKMNSEAGHAYYIRLHVDDAKFAAGLPGSGMDEDMAALDTIKAVANPAPDAGPFLIKIVEQKEVLPELQALKESVDCQ